MQEITFDELSTLKQPSASLRTALDKISAALGSVGDAGQQARMRCGRAARVAAGCGGTEREIGPQPGKI